VNGIAFIDKNSSAFLKGSIDNITVACDPTDIRRAPIDISRFLNQVPIEWLAWTIKDNQLSHVVSL